MRVTQNMLYGDMVHNMNGLLYDYMVSNEQAATQKRVNAPSDDPVGTVQILNYRASIANTTQYIDNSGDASSWLASQDSALTQAQVIMVRLSELAEQASTGTYTDTNRDQIAFEVRELFDQLINVANTEFNNQHLFSGHKTDINAFSPGLTVSSYNAEMQGIDFTVDGGLTETAMVRFPADGQLGDGTDLTYEYSLDGGESWATTTLSGADNTVGAPGFKLSVGGASLTPQITGPVAVTAYDAGLDPAPDNGTMLFVRPTAIYNGDDSNPPPDVDLYGNKNISNPKAYGSFNNNVQIKIMDDANVATEGEIRYTYSTDNGISWTEASVPTSSSTSVPANVRFVVPGGYLDVEVGGDGTLTEGQQLVIRPDRADDIGFEIAEGEFFDVTTAGKDIFGGLYQDKNADYASAVDGANIFETIGIFISALETNNMDEVAETLDRLKEADEHLLSELASIGGKENRMTLNISILQSRSDDETSRLSALEDVDIAQLTIDMTKQKTAYEMVLQTSSMIMNMSLLNYL